MSITATSYRTEAPELPIHSAYSAKRPITSILGEQTATQEKVEFCYQVAQRTLTALLGRQYSEFDAQTTSNCCHGMSLLARELICLSKQEDLQGLQATVAKRIDAGQTDPNFALPSTIIDLCQLYILSYIRSICPEKGIRTAAGKLQSISPLKRETRDSLVKQLQRDYSNRVAFQYQNYLDTTEGVVETCGIPIELWGKYVSTPYIRQSSQNIHFAPCLYSMQVTLAHLIQSKAKIAIVNDIYDSTDTLSKRYVKILAGNGVNDFDTIQPHPNASNEPVSDEPLVVFGGCAYNDNPDRVIAQMDQWMNRFPNLVLACDTFYPQFPKTCDDPNFRNSTIIPEEKILQNIIDQHHKLDGVSAGNPSFYCLNHIYPSSLSQVLSNNFSSYKIPKVLWQSESTLSK